MEIKMKSKILIYIALATTIPTISAKMAAGIVRTPYDSTITKENTNKILSLLQTVDEKLDYLTTLVQTAHPEILIDDTKQIQQ